jgi:hypothetical protein
MPVMPQCGTFNIECYIRASCCASSVNIHMLGHKQPFVRLFITYKLYYYMFRLQSHHQAAIHSEHSLSLTEFAAVAV